MDKSKASRGVKGSKGHQPFPGSGELIALGSKTSGGGSASSTPPTSSHSSPRPSSSGSGSERKRESGSVSSLAPPQKKSRLAGGLGSSSSASSGRHVTSSSSSHKSSSSSKAIRRDPLEPTGADVNPADLSSDRFFTLLEAAHKSAASSDHIQNLLIAGVKRLKASTAKEKEQLQIVHNLLLGAKDFGECFQSRAVQDALISLIAPTSKKILPETKVKVAGPFVSVAITILTLSHANASHWPATFSQFWLEDACGDRTWVDLPHFKPFVENLLISFGTVLPSSNLLPPSDGGAPGGGGSSPAAHAMSDDSSLQQDLNSILEDFPLYIPIMNRYSGSEGAVESLIVEYATELIQKKASEIPRNLIRSLGFGCGLSGVRAWVVTRVEQWLHNAKTARYAQELLLHLCINANCNTSADAEVVSQLSKLRMKTKPLVHMYSIALREMVRDNETNLKNVLNQIIYNELSPQRNPNNLPLLGAIISGVVESRAVLADVFIDLLQKREDFHPALRLLLREIVRAARYEVDLTKFVLGLVKHREDITWQAECRERAFTSITDLIVLSMFLSVSPQVREASAVAAVRGESKDLSTLSNFRTLVGLIQQEGITWMYGVVPKMFRPQKKDFVIALNKIYLRDPMNDVVTKDGWPPESEKNLFTRLCLELEIQENAFVYTMMMGMSKEHPVTAVEILDLVEHVICRAALHKTGPNLHKMEILELLFRLAEYYYPDNISLPQGYEPPKLAISKNYWRVWTLLCIICAHNPQTFGKTGWADYPTLKMFMEMCMTNHFTFPTPSNTESSEQFANRELQRCAMEQEQILEFELHLCAATSKAPVTKANSLLLTSLMGVDTFGAPRTPPPPVLVQLQTLNEQMQLGHQLCRSRNPDFLLDLIQRNSEPMPWLSRLVSEGSFEILPVQCLCEFMLGHMDSLQKALLAHKDAVEAADKSPRKQVKGSTPLELSKEDAKLLQLLNHLQEIVYGSAEESEAREVLEYFLRRLSSPKTQNRIQAVQAMELLLGKNESSSASEGGEHWLLDCLPTLKVFAEMQASVLVLLRQAIQVETEPCWVVSYLEFLSTWAHLSHDLDSLALDVAQLVVERNGFSVTMLTKFPTCFDSLFDIFSNYMKKIRESHKETYKWSESHDQVLVQWDLEKLEATMNILIIHAIVLLLSAYKPSLGGGSTSGKRAVSRKDLKYSELLDVWFPNREENFPKGFLLNTSEEAVLFPDWIKLRMIRSGNSRLLAAALQDLEAEQLMLFVQHFGVPVQSMTALLYCLDKVAEQNEEQVVSDMVNAPYMHTLVRLQWKRGAQGGEKFVRLLKTRCGVPDDMDVNKSKDPPPPVRPVLNLPSVKDSSRSNSKSKGKSNSPTTPRLSTHKGMSQQKFVVSPTKRSIGDLSKELLLLSSPPSSGKRRASMPVVKGDEGSLSTRRHSSHLDVHRESDEREETGNGSVEGGRNTAKDQYLGELVDSMTELEPCIVRNALEYQLPLLFGRNENVSSCRSFLMTALAHQAGWETVQDTLTLFLGKFDSAYDPSSILDLIYATLMNPKLWQGIDKYVPKHQPNIAVLHLTPAQLLVMTEYIVEEISQMEMKSTTFSITNLLGSSAASSQPQAGLKRSRKSLQERVQLWLQCCHQQKSLVDSVIHNLMDKKGRNPCAKKFVCQVYMEFPEVILVDNWKWKTEELSLTEEEISSIIDSISHGLITALAKTEPGKEWAKNKAHDIEICLRKLASLHPSLLIRQLPLMGTLLEGRVHLEASVFHQQNHNLPFVVYLALFELMQPHILKHFKTLKPTLLLYIKLFKNYGLQKDYSSSLSRFSVLLHNFMSTSPTEVKEFLSPHYSTLRELSSVKYYIEVATLQNLIGSLIPPTGDGSNNSVSTGGTAGPAGPSSMGGSVDFLSHAISSINDRLIHVSNHEEMIPVMQELDVLSNRNPGILSHFSQTLNPLLQSKTESCRTLAFSLVLKHATYCPGSSFVYLDSVLQLLEDEHSHLRETMMDRIHEFVTLAQERGGEILERMFQLGVSSNLNFVGPINKSMALLRNYSAIPPTEP